MWHTKPATQPKQSPQKKKTGTLVEIIPCGLSYFAKTLKQMVFRGASAKKQQFGFLSSL